MEHLSREPPFLRPFHSGHQQLYCDLVLLWSHSGSLFSHHEHSAEWCPFSSMGLCAADQQGAVSFLDFDLFFRTFPGFIVITFSLSANSWTLRNRHPHKQNDIMKNRPQILAHQQNRWNFEGKKTTLERLAWFYYTQNVVHSLPMQSMTA